MICMCVSTYSFLVLGACKPIKSIPSNCNMYVPATLLQVSFANGCKGSARSKSKICLQVLPFSHFCQAFVLFSKHWLVVFLRYLFPFQPSPDSPRMPRCLNAPGTLSKRRTVPFCSWCFWAEEGFFGKPNMATDLQYIWMKPWTKIWVLNQKIGVFYPPNPPFVHRVGTIIFTIHFGGTIIFGNIHIKYHFFPSGFPISRVFSRGFHCFGVLSMSIWLWLWFGVFVYLATLQEHRGSSPFFGAGGNIKFVSWTL